jgi:hypothetical protein
MLLVHIEVLPFKSNKDSSVALSILIFALFETFVTPITMLAVGNLMRAMGPITAPGALHHRLSNLDQTLHFALILRQRGLVIDAIRPAVEGRVKTDLDLLARREGSDSKLWSLSVEPRFIVLKHTEPTRTQKIVK